MRVILKTNQENLGKMGDVVNVKSGYARNYLIPKDIAMLATPGNLKLFEQQRKKLQEKLDKDLQAAKSEAEKLEELNLTIPVRVGENEKLYGSITNTHIAQALKDQGFDIDKKKIELNKPIRALGDYEIEIKLYPEVRPKIKVSVVRYEHEEQSGEGKEEQS